MLVAMSSIFIVNESQIAIVLNLGKVVRSDLQPGLHFKWPLVEDVRKFDRRILTLDDAPERYLTSEKKDVDVDFFVKWRISDVTTFYRAASGGDEGAAQAAPDADRQGRAAQRDQPAARCRQVVSSGRSDLTGRLLKNINDARRHARHRSASTSASSASTCRRTATSWTRCSTACAPSARRSPTSCAPKASRPRRSIRAEAERERQVIAGRRRARRPDAARRGRWPRRPRSAPRPTARTPSSTPSTAAWRPTGPRWRDGKTVMVLDPDSEFLRYFGRDNR